MRNNLHSRAKVFAATFLVQHIPVNLTCGKIGIFVEIFINKALVMTEIQVGFSTVLGHIYFTVLIRAHCTGINIDIRVKLLCGNLETSCF